MDFRERTYRDPFGATVIQSRLAPAGTRQGFERQLLPGVAVGLAGWQRAHSQGAGTGSESASGILYAPEAVNQEYQRLGIERFLREVFAAAPASVTLWLTTVTSAHPLTRRLKEIQYRVDAVHGSRSRRLFEASIEVSNDRVAPRVRIEATPFITAF